MYDIYIENLTLKIKETNASGNEENVKAIRNAINEFEGYISKIETKDNLLYLEVDISFINIYCIEKDFFKLPAIPKDNFKKLRFIINLTKNYIDISDLKKGNKIKIKIAVVKDLEILENGITNIFKQKIFVVSKINEK